MAHVSGEQPAWKRSKYPLQPGLQKIARKLHVGSDLNDVPLSSSDSGQLSRKRRVESTVKLESQPPAETTHSEQRDSIKPRAGENNSHAINQSSSGILTNSNATEFDSTPSRSASLKTASTMGYHVATTTTPPEEKQQEVAERPSEDSVSPERTRTLRRSQRSQRLEGRTSLPDIEAAAQPAQPAESTSNDHAVQPRQALSTQHTSKMATTSLDTPPMSPNKSEKVDDTIASNMRKQHNALPASPPTSERGSPRPSSTPSPQHDRNAAAAEAAEAAETKVGTWRSSKYPLQKTAHGAVSQHPSIPPPPKHDVEQTEAKSVDQHGTSMHVPSAMATSETHSYPIQSPTSTAEPSQPSKQATEISSSKTSTKTQAMSAVNPEKKTESHATNKMPRRQGYPLQQPLSTWNLQQPSSTTNEVHLQGACQSSPEHIAPSDGKVLHLSQHPIPSSTTAANTQQQKGITLGQDHQDRASETTSNHKAPFNGKVSRLGRYPLQSPASTRDLRQQSSSTSGQSDQNGAKQTTSDQKAPSQSKAPKRGKYPLQSPASAVNLTESHPSPKSEHNADVAQQRPHTEADAPRKGPRRGGYPLQALASNVNPRDPPAQVNQHEQPATIQNNERIGNTASSPTFRRQGYPLQSSFTPTGTQRAHSASYSSSSSATTSDTSTEENSPTHLPPPPYVSEEQARKDEQASKVFLPKNIRAVKEASQVLKGRTIVVCLDGTGDKFDDDNSNIVHIVSALKKDDSQQVTYYQAGIGTYNDGGLSSGFNAALDMAVGSGLGLHVRDAYHFLMHSYKEGDRICIFGFSRGAYTARCLAGMVHKVGLLPPRNLQQIQFAYEFYKDDTERGWQSSNDFKRAFSIDVNVHFLGCFDSVASVGFIPRQLPLSSTPNNKVRHFRHAMALDERRAKFKICRYQSAKKQGQPVDSADEGFSDNESTVTKVIRKATGAKDQHDSPAKLSENTPYGKESHPNVTEAEYDRLYGHEEDFDTDVSEVWFAGCHADVGGGAVANIERHKLAQIPLRWMIRSTFECNTGIIWKTRMLAEYGLDVHSLWPKYGRLDVPPYMHAPPTNFLRKYEEKLPPRTIRRSKLVAVQARESHHTQEHGSEHADHHGEPWYHFKGHEDEDWTPEQVEDYYDAMTEMNDQLVAAPIWWILEAVPVQYKMCYKPGEIVTVTGPNMGLARMVEDHDAQIHWTVAQRAKRMGYKAAARPAKHTEWRVVT